MKFSITNTAIRLVKSGFFICCVAGPAVRLPAAIVCDGDPVPAMLTATNSTLSVLGSNIDGFLFKLASPVGNDTHLSVAYNGTAKNGIDVQSLPASVLITAGATSALVTVKPKANYPFSTKSLSATITQSDNVCVVLGSPKTATITLIGFDPPRLDAAVLDSTKMVLSWWAPVTRYGLQSAHQLTPSSWLTVTNAPAGVQGTNQFTLTRSSSALFYRLMKP
jgi:hypothetical protein